jgi:hypothetical protein
VPDRPASFAYAPIKPSFSAMSSIEIPPFVPSPTTFASAAPISSDVTPNFSFSVPAIFPIVSIGSCAPVAAIAMSRSAFRVNS